MRDLNGQEDCVLPQTIDPGNSYICTITTSLDGEPGDHTNEVTASGTDDEGNPVSDSDDATVTINATPV